MTFRFQGGSRRLSAAEINRWNSLANRDGRGELRRRVPPRLKSFDPNSRVALCKNTSGSDRAAFDCMAIDDLLWTLDTDGTSDIVLKLITADPAKAAAVLIEPIENGQIGRAVIDGVCIAKVGGGSGTTGAAVAASHRINPTGGSAIKLLTAPHATDVRLLPVVLNAGGGGGGGIDDVRWLDPILEYHDASGWHTIDTAETCSGGGSFFGSF